MPVLPCMCIGALAPEAPVSNTCEAQHGAAASMLDQYLQQQCGPLLQDIGHVQLELEAASAQHSNSFSSVASSLGAHVAPPDIMATSATHSGRGVACPTSNHTPKQRPRSTPGRSAGIGRFSLTSSHDTMQGLHIDHISVEFSRASNSNIGSSARAASAVEPSAQPLPMAGGAGGASYVAVTDLKTLVDEADVSCFGLHFGLH